MKQWILKMTGDKEVGRRPIYGLELSSQTPLLGFFAETKIWAENEEYSQNKLQRI